MLLTVGFRAAVRASGNGQVQQSRRGDTGRVYQGTSN